MNKSRSNPPTERLPSYLRKPSGADASTAELKRLLRSTSLHTVCEEAKCPNISECFSRGTATFMILGDVCTRGCRFCAVTTGKPHFAEREFESEAARVAEAASVLGLSYVVVTSVARDDLADGGAQGFAYTIQALRERIAGVKVEVLVPDFRGKKDAVHTVLDARPDVFNHNLETVPRLYRRVRPGAQYHGSLQLLQTASDKGITSKTGIMLGLGEQPDEVRQVMIDSRAHGVDVFTAGQYMRPSRSHLPVESYLTIPEFDYYRDMAREIGFAHVFIGPLVRSSYHADEVVALT